MYLTQGFHMSLAFIWINGILSFNYLVLTGHECKYPGCKNVIVIDGNMKNRRDVCAATEAGYIQYNGLPGKINTGCQLTPLQAQKFCYYHAERAFKSVSPLQPNQQSTECNLSSEEGVVKLIVSKKQIRSGTYYQVRI